MYPPWLDFESGWHLVRLLGRLTFDQMYPQQRHLVAKCVTTLVRLTSGQMYTPRMRLWVRLTFSQTLVQADLWFLFFPIACLICDYKSNSSKVVPGCSNTPDWWWKDMHKLVWTENSLDSILYIWCKNMWLCNVDTKLQMVPVSSANGI